MIFIHFKGKGILVLIYAIVPIVVLTILTLFIEKYYFNDKFPEEVYYMCAGISLLISGLWTHLTADEYYINEDGEKIYIYFDNKFMFIDMKIWVYIFWVFGGYALVGGLISLISNLAEKH